jgi:hypothetical protein
MQKILHSEMNLIRYYSARLGWTKYQHMNKMRELTEYHFTLFVDGKILL